MSRAILLFLHLSGAIVWVGGMFFAHFCLRPAALATLSPAQRLPLWHAVLARFLPSAGLGVAAILLSGGALLARVGFAAAPLGWHLMLAVGAVMAAIYLLVAFVFYPRFAERCTASDWPAAAALLDRIRRLVTTNLILSVVVLVAAATSA